jgi:alpha-glucosidase (family GH31 glycosyl hydrolase)
MSWYESIQENVVSATSEKRCLKQKPAVEHFFGLEQSRKGFDKTGKTVVSWNRDIMCGYALWAHDVGGFAGSPGSSELEARWLAFGALSPVSQIHYEIGGTYKQEPWEFGADVEAIAKRK